MAIKTKSYWWLSFADKGFMGACIVAADDFLSAVSVSHALKINPGGQVAGVPVPDGYPLRPDEIGRLFNREEAEAFK